LSNFSIIETIDIINNEYGIKVISSSENNLFYHNNFIDNDQNAYDECINFWDNGYPSGGNYWNDYTGYDNNGDGIGEDPYYIPDGSNQDNYPFIEQNGWLQSTNQPPNKPSKPSGFASGKIGVEYEYSSSAIDPDGDMVFLLFDWGDKTSDLVGPCNSGDVMTISHMWTAVGTYSVKVKATDNTHFAESVWSDPLAVSMPKTRIHNLILQLIMRMLERFPFFEKILNQILP